MMHRLRLIAMPGAGSPPVVPTDDQGNVLVGQALLSPEQVLVRALVAWLEGTAPVLVIPPGSTVAAVGEDGRLLWSVGPWVPPGEGPPPRVLETLLPLAPSGGV